MRHTVSTFHKENSKLRFSSDEQAIQDMDCLIDDYDCDPFDFQKPELRSLQSVEGNKYDELRQFYHKVASNETLSYMWAQHVSRFQSPRTQLNRRSVKEFPCNTHRASTDVPTSVHQLEPWDIKVVGALGDSITAGNGILAEWWTGVLVEYRGRSWSIGGDQSYDADVVTLPNILRKYNPNLKGFSLDYGKRVSAISRFNVADPGDTAYEMPAQAHMLVERMKADPTVDFQNDWKLITMFIGGNDLCESCEDDYVRHSAANYKMKLQQTLDILKAEVPRAFVNLVETLDVTPVAALSTGFFCTAVHAFVCDCARQLNQKSTVKALAREYQQATEQLVASGRYDTSNDFTVVVQPFFRNTEPPRGTEPDMSYFSTDCFHFSEKGQKAAAIALWNNMIERVGHKQTQWYTEDTLHCPTTHGHPGHYYFATRLNSQL
ncbi:hypothetical protein ScPMuIL_015652 [Solemya velum]